MFIGDKIQDIEAENWITEKPDLENGKYLLHFWTSSCIRCHGELETLLQLARRESIDIVTIHQPRYEFEDVDHLHRTLKDKDFDHYAAHKPYKKKWFTEHSPKKLVIEQGRIRYHSNHKHSLDELQESLNVEKKINPPKRTNERKLGLRNSAVHEDQRFHGEKKVDKPESTKKEHIHLQGRWKQTETHIEALENARLYLSTNSSEIYLTVDPKNSIKDIDISVDYEYLPEGGGAGFTDKEGRSINRVKLPGVVHVLSSDNKQKEVEISVEKGLRLYKIDLC